MTTKTKAPEITTEDIQQYLATLEPQAVEFLATYWRNADLVPVYPVEDLETIAELMDANGYRCNRDSILRMIEEHVIPSPERRNGRLIWNAVNITQLITACEMRRRWKPFARFHQHKLSQFEKLQEIAQANGGKSAFSDLMFFDLSGLVAMLHEPGMADQGARQALAAALSEKLRGMGIDI